MKKIFLLTGVMALTACSTYHTGKTGFTITNPDVEFIPMEAKVTVDDSSKISGSAECSSLLWVFNSAPERQAYGASLQVSDGNFAPQECVAAAIYDAMSDTGADVIVAPHYTTVRNGLLCFGSKCLTGKTKVLVQGFSGKITSIKDMDKSVVQERQKNNSKEQSSSKLFF